MSDSVDSVVVDADEDARYASFVRHRGALLRRALVARYGVEVGVEATNDALLVAWREWADVAGMDNPVGYLFRAGQSAARPTVRWRNRTVPLDFPDEPAEHRMADHVDLFDALSRLNPSQRVAVVLVKSHGHTYAEAAEALGVSEAAVGNHVRRGLRALRRQLGEQP